MPLNTALAQEVWNRYQFCRDNGHIHFINKAEKCERFFSGDQWDKNDLAKLRQQRRPALTINKILPTMGAVMGEQIKNRAEINFRPRMESYAETADALNKVFKQISDVNQLNWLRSQMFDDGVITSRGFLDVRMDFSKSLKGEVKIASINPKNVVIDPDGELMDPDTWSEVIVTKWLTADDIAVLYSEEDADILRRKDGSAFPYGYDSITEERDRFGPRTTYGYNEATASANQRNIRIIDRQYRKLAKQDFFVDPKTGDMRPVPAGWDKARVKLICNEFGFEILKRMVRRIRWTVIADDVVLHDDWSPYEHFTTVPYFPYFRYGNAIGLVENLLDPQELLNKTTSQELHVINSSANGGWKVKQGALANMSVEELEANGAMTGLVLELTGDLDEVEKLQPNATPQGLDRMSYKAEEHIKSISNVSDSMVGQDRADVAAKAIQEKKQSGQVTLVKPLDNLTRTDTFLARAVLSLVQRFYTQERLITFTQDELTGKTGSIVINQRTPEGNIANDLTLGEFDIVVESVPVKSTLEDSQFEQVSALKEMGVAIPDEVLIQASRLHDKKAVLEKMAARAQTPEAQQQAQIQLQMLQKELEKLQAEIDKINAEAALKGANSQAVTVKAQKDAATPIDAGDGGAAAMASVDAQREKNAATIQLEREKAAAKMQLEREAAEHDAQIKAQEAQRDDELARQAAAESRINALTNPQPTTDKED